MKLFQFQFSRDAEKMFSTLPSLVQKRIFNKFAFFERTDAPLSFAKKLQGFNDLYRFRVGDYRIIVKPKAQEIMIILLVLKIGHRKDIYES